MTEARFLYWFAVVWALAMYLAFLREIGSWLNARAARKTLLLLHAVAFWAAEPDGCE